MTEVKSNPQSSFERCNEFSLNKTDVSSPFTEIPTAPPPLPANKKEIKGIFF